MKPTTSSTRNTRNRTLSRFDAPRSLSPIIGEGDAPLALRHSSLFTACGAALLFTHTAFAQTWQTADDFQYVAGQSAGNAALAVTQNGALLAAGNGYDAAGVGHALVMSSADGGITWPAPLD